MGLRRNRKPAKARKAPDAGTGKGQTAGGPKKAKKRPAIHSRIRSALQRVWRFSEMRREALAKARITRGVYLCAACGKLLTVGETNVDHINPAVPVSGFDSWSGFIERLFCPADGLQVLCEGCHALKTALERNYRREAKCKK